MKKTLAALAALMITVASYGQGTVTFNNKVGTDVDAKVSRPDGTGAGAGITAQLFLVGATGSLTPVTPSTTFRSTSAAAAYYVNALEIPITGTLGGDVVKLRLRAFDGASYDTATSLRGQSSDITVTLGGAGSPPSLPALLTGLTGFTLVAVPEPSTIALGVLGLGALLIRRRK